MRSKKELQLLGENFVTNQLLAKQYTLLGRNVRRRQYEFDIVCSRNSKLYVVEVRATEQKEYILTQIFPIKKLLTLQRGVSIYFPQAVLICSLVNANDGTNIQCTYFNAIDLF